MLTKYFETTIFSFDFFTWIYFRLIPVNIVFLTSFLIEFPLLLVILLELLGKMESIKIFIQIYREFQFEFSVKT